MLDHAELVRIAEAGRELRSAPLGRMDESRLDGYIYDPELSPDRIKAALAVIEAAEAQEFCPFCGAEVLAFAGHKADCPLAAWNALTDPEGSNE